MKAAVGNLTWLDWLSKKPEAAQHVVKIGPMAVELVRG